MKGLGRDGTGTLFFCADNFKYLWHIFTKDFSAVSNLFFWQLLGDFFRAAALILAIQFFAKKLVKPYFITEIISFTILIFSSYFGIQIFGVEGAVMAYAVTYFLYFIVVSIYFRKMMI